MWVIRICKYVVVQTFNVSPAVIRENAALHKCILYKLRAKRYIVVVSAVVLFPPLYVQGTLILVPVQFFHGDSMSNE